MTKMVGDATEKSGTSTGLGGPRLENPQVGRIVVGVDGSESSKDALLWAANQANLTGERLDVVLSWEVPPVPCGV
jgi:Universal stress protein family